MVLRSSSSSLTEGSIWKSMLLFALPVFLGNVFQQLYNTFDSWVVGNYLGDNALAAVSSSGLSGRAWRLSSSTWTVCPAGRVLMSNA